MDQKLHHNRMNKEDTASPVHSSLSLTPVQNKNHDAAQVWDHNCGRLTTAIPEMAESYKDKGRNVRQIIPVLLVVSSNQAPKQCICKYIDLHSCRWCDVLSLKMAKVSMILMHSKKCFLMHTPNVKGNVRLHLSIV